jgi:hypothetical protein
LPHTRQRCACIGHRDRGLEHEVAAPLARPAPPRGREPPRPRRSLAGDGRRVPHDVRAGRDRSPRITKWAHYARFERRILDADFVQGLHCTFEPARRVPYHRLPLRSLWLAALVHHLYGTAVDKTLQRADWGQRPLNAEQLDYAAWDPEWCYRVHRGLDPLVRSWDPAADDPAAIQSRYVEILPLERDASRWRTAMWDAIKTFMVASSHERFAAFLLQKRVVRRVPIRVLAAAVAEVDPMGVTEIAVPVPAALLSALRVGGEAAVREAGQETISTRFRGPRAARAANGNRSTRSIRAIPTRWPRSTPRPGTTIGSSSPSARS